MNEELIQKMRQAAGMAPKTGSILSDLESSQIPVQQEKGADFSTREPSMAGMFATEPIKTLIARPAVRVGQLLGVGAAKLLGADEEMISRALEEEVTLPTPFGGIKIPPVKDKKQILGEALETASYLFPYGKAATGVTSALRTVGLKKGVSALGKIASGATGGGLIDVGLQLQEGEKIRPSLGTALGAAIPGLGVAAGTVRRIAPKAAGRVVDSLIRPLLKDFSYGKQPGRGVAAEGIVADNMEELAAQIEARRKARGSEIGQLRKGLSQETKLRLNPALQYIDDAMNKAAEQNNGIVIQRLQDVKRAITEELVLGVDEIGRPAIVSKGAKNMETASYEGAYDILGKIGDMTRYTGNVSDDNAVNLALKKTYGSVRDIIETNIGKESKQKLEVAKQLNDRYADLLSAEIATRYREKIMQRLNIIGLTPLQAGIGSAILTAIATGGATIPTVLVGITGASIDKLFASTAFKTRLAKALRTLTPAAQQQLIDKVPIIQTVVSKFGQFQFPGDAAVEEFGPKVKEYLKNPKIGLSLEDVTKTQQTLRGTKGMTADDIMKTYPNIKLTKDVAAKDVYGNKVTIPDGEKLTPYEMKDGKILLQDGETYLVSKNQFQNIKGNTVGGEAKPFAPELDTLEETVKGAGQWKGDELIGDGKVVANVVKNEDGTWSYQSDLSEGSDTFKTRKEAMDAAFDEITDPYAETGTKYSSYTLPGGENYKEVLIKAPTKPKGEYGKIEVDMESKYGKNWNEQMTYEERQTAIRAFKAGESMVSRKDVFKSSHWDEPNVISHLRLNERTYKGKKVTFMEELQSDWARELRSKGENKMPIEGEDFRLKYNSVYKTYTIEDLKGGGEKGSSYRTRALAYEAADEIFSGGVVSNPLLKNWQELSVKRALKEAVDNNSEYFAWINGEQTSARYNLATKLKSVNWRTTSGQGGKSINMATPEGRDIRFLLDKEGKVASAGGGVPEDWIGKRLDEVLGKGLADKIMAKETGTLSGEGLKFGGEWANTLYDKQVGNIVKDLTGAKVEVLDMGLPIDKVKETLRIGTDAFKPLLKKDLKVGQEFNKGIRDSQYIITDILGDGKFKAVPKSNWESMQSAKRKGGIYDDEFIQNERIRTEETFDISQKTTQQQGIKITPEVKAKIQGKAPEIKTSGKMYDVLPQEIQKTFDELSKIPKGVFIDRPTELVSTPYLISDEIKKITNASGKISFTRRSIKHLSEKGAEGERLIKIVPDVLKTPDEIRQGDLGNRYLISKKFKDIKGGRPQVVNLEVTEKDGDIIVTSFQSDDGYLSDYELLWRSGVSK